MSDVSNNVEHLIIPKDKVPTAAYQAIYHKLTTKVEKLSQIFDEAYTISAEDIIQLDHRLCQMIKQYPIKGQSSTCSVSLRQHERLDSSSIEKFVL